MSAARASRRRIGGEREGRPLGWSAPEFGAGQAGRIEVVDLGEAEPAEQPIASEPSEATTRDTEPGFELAAETS